MLISATFKSNLRRALLACAMSLVLLTPSVGQTIIDPTKLLTNYSPLASQFLNTKGMYENYHACVARGIDKDTCANLAVFCYFKNAYFGKAYPGFVGALQIFDSFAIDCGKGTCYQCCYRPNKGCHTSFVGYPVINCNENLYGKGTIDAGLTMIVDPNAKPGAPCLYTPQTCDHVPQCHYNGKTNIPALEQKLATGAPHALNWKHSKSWRARTVARGVRNMCIKYLNSYSSDQLSLNQLHDMIYGRGCKSWRTNMTKVWPFDWSLGAFLVKDKKGKAAPPASQYNAWVQLCTYRTLAALPNLLERMNYTESRVWSAASKKSYMAAVTDPDKEILQYASPVALGVLKQINAIQDYKLLSIARPGEPSLKGTYNGCVLGQPPQADLSYQQDGSVGIKLAVKVTDPEFPAATLDNPLLVLWGDGKVSVVTVPGATKMATVSHTYQLGGSYMVQVMVANDSGLRGITALAVQTATSAGVKAPPSFIPAVTRVGLEQFAVTEKSLSGNNFGMYFDMYLEDDKAKKYRVGKSKWKSVALNATTSFGELAGHNEAGLTMKKLVIKPHFTIGFAIGLNEMYFATNKLRLDVYNTVTDTYQSASVYLLPQDVAVYPKGSTTPIPASALKTDASGRLKIPIFSKVKGSWTRTERVEIAITSAMFSAMLLGPTSQKLAHGKQWKWIEPRPWLLKRVPVCGNADTESPEECDDGNAVDGDGCSTKCKAELTPAGVVNFSAARGGIGVVLSWKTQALQNCKTFSVLRCQGASCSAKAAHQTLASLGSIPCKYSSGGDSYSYLDTGASPLMQVSYYLRQHGAKISVTDYGPALVPGPTPDMGPPDLSPPDLSLPDLSPPDLSLPDMGQPDQAAPDLLQPDTVAAADAALPDKGQPDAGGPAPDQNVPNKDLPVPDSQQPDQRSGREASVSLADQGPDQGGSKVPPSSSGCAVAADQRGVPSWLLIGLMLLAGWFRRFTCRWR